MVQEQQYQQEQGATMTTEQQQQQQSSNSSKQQAGVSKAQQGHSSFKPKTTVTLQLTGKMPLSKISFDSACLARSSSKSTSRSTRRLHPCACMLSANRNAASPAAKSKGW